MASSEVGKEELKERCTVTWNVLSLKKISPRLISFALFIRSDPIIQRSQSIIPAKHQSDIILNTKACKHFA